jgi:hypothetical protein
MPAALRTVFSSNGAETIGHSYTKTKIENLELYTSHQIQN